MSKSQRDKGAAAERELRRMLADALGEAVARNLGQVRDGGHDLTGVGPFALEVKRAEKLQVETWWRQAEEQAANQCLLPALAYRQSRQPWTILVPLYAVNLALAPGPERVALSVTGFAAVVRERISQTEAA